VREAIEAYLDRISEYVWAQFEKDMEMSLKVMEYLNTVWGNLYGIFVPKK
jgi:hypothetical protein